MADHDLVLLSLLALSAAGHLYALHLLKKRSSERKPTRDAADILNDLTRSGVSIVKVSRVDPEDIFLRSPRDIG